MNNNSYLVNNLSSWTSREGMIFSKQVRNTLLSLWFTFGIIFNNLDNVSASVNRSGKNDPIVTTSQNSKANIGKIYPPTWTIFNVDNIITEDTTTTLDSTREEPIIHKHLSQKEINSLLNKKEEEPIIHKHLSQKEINKMSGINSPTIFDSIKWLFSKVWKFLKNSKEFLFFNKNKNFANNNSILAWKKEDNQLFFEGEVLSKNNNTRIPRKNKYVPWEYPDKVIMKTYWGDSTWKWDGLSLVNNWDKYVPWKYSKEAVMWTYWGDNLSEIKRNDDLWWFI